MSSGTRDSVGQVLWRIAGRLHLRRSTVEEFLQTDRGLRRDVSILGRGIEVGMTLTEARFGLTLERSCPRDMRMFMRQGTHRLVVYRGVPKQVSDSNGMSYIALLLQAPGKEIHASELRALVSGMYADVALNSPDEVLDDEAIKAYRAELASVEKKLKEGTAGNDPERKRFLVVERAWYQKELRRGADRRGEPKKVSVDAERARKSVAIAIRRALEVIRRVHKPLWHHLYTSLEMGEFLSYRGDPSPPWIT